VPVEGALAPPPFELDNRGKRSVALDLGSEEGREIAYRLVDEADVFVSNLRASALRRLEFDHETLRARNRRLVYAMMTGYGLDTDEEDRPSYDVGAFWARSGLASMHTAPGAPLPMLRGGFGDHTAGAQLAGAISAALFHRERTGEGQLVAGSLIRSGVYTMGWDYNTALRTGTAPQPFQRETFIQPLIACYPVKDGRWIWLIMLEADRHWPDFCRAVDREQWLTDERFETALSRAQNAADLVQAIEAVLGERTVEEWAPVFDAHDVWWAPVQTMSEVIADPAFDAAGAWAEVPSGGQPARMVASPIDFRGTPWAARSGAPGLGQHTEEVLLELGYDWDAIARLKDGSVIP
jgi:crotonobetainyl-CoA:carnitine CoA-transferase CaiB-like acyl-CoA transferase